MVQLFGSAPSNRTAVWYPPPETRGSFNILSSCIITLVLCIWTAVHLNIPEKDRGPKRKKWDPRGWLTKQQRRKAIWVVVGLFAPELIAYIAWEQRRYAQHLTRILGRKIDLRPSLRSHGVSILNLSDIESVPSHDVRRGERSHDWTLTHSFFACMGGFAFDTSTLAPEQNFLPGNRTRVVLDSRAVWALAKAEPHLLPDIPQAFINDKSKANSLAKAVVCLQAVWFIVQCISRISHGLALSVLELNTFAHALCALLTYIFWWGKPLDVEEPVIIRGEQMHGICAYLCFYSEFDGISDAQRVSGSQQDEQLHSSILKIKETQHSCSAQDRRRWAILKSVWEKYAQVIGLDYEILGLDYHISKYPFETMEDCIRDRVSNLINGHSYDPIATKKHASSRAGYSYGTVKIDGTITMPAFILANLLYGAIHLLAWKAPWTSSLHSLLWRISSISIAVYGPASVLFIIVVGTSAALLTSKNKEEGNAKHNSWRSIYFRSFKIVVRISAAVLKIKGEEEQKDKKNLWGSIYSRFLGMIFLASAFSFLSLYVFARVFLVVECFISFAYLPESAFRQPQWLSYFPHIG